MKTKTHKRLLAVLTTASIFAAAIPAVQTYKYPMGIAVSAAEAGDMTVSGETVHLPDSLLKDEGYIFGVRKVENGSEKKYFLYYRDATVKDESGEPAGDIVNIQEFDGSIFPKPDYKTMNNLTGDAATDEAPATGEKLVMDELVAQAIEDYFLNEDTGVWFTDAEKIEKVAIPRVDVNGSLVNEPGIVVEAEIPETKCLKNNNTLIEALIKLYDAEEGHEEDYAFKNDMSLYDADTKEITDAGYEELYRIFSSDIKTAIGKASDVKKAYNAIISRTQSQELNRMNREINASDEVDLEKAKWVLETKSDLEAAKKVYPKTSPYAKFWSPKADDPTSGTYVSEASGSSVLVSKTTANGKFNNEVVLKAVTSDYSPATSKLPNGKGSVYVSCSFYVVPAKSTAYKEDTLNVQKKLSGINFAKTDDSSYTLQLDAGKSYKLPFAVGDGTDKSLIYEAEGSGFTVKNGIVKGCGEGSGTIKVYPSDCYDKDSMTLTVNVSVSAVVKAIRANTNTVSMYPGSSQTISLGTVPPSYGKYTYALHGLNSAYTAKIEGDTLTISSDGKKALPKLNRIAVTIVQNNKNLSGIKNMYITIKGIAVPQNITKIRETNRKLGSDGAVEINMLKGTAYNLGVSAYPVTCDATLIPTVGVGINDDGTLNEGFEPITVKTYDEFISLYGTGGAKQNLSAVSYVRTKMDRYYSRAISGSVTGVGRPSEDDEGAYSEWLSYYSSALALYNSAKKSAQVDTSVMNVSGDVISCDTAGTYYLQYTSAAKTASGEKLRSDIYKINVYEAGSSIVMEDLRGTQYYDSNGDKKLTAADSALGADDTYAIVGGNLMTVKSADTDSSRIFRGGTTITIPKPCCLGADEEIEWKCSKPGAVKISEGSDYITVENGKVKTHPTLDLMLCQTSLTDTLSQPIPFTITGTSKYTKQKFSFRISIVNDTDISQELSNTNATLSFTDSSGKDISQPKKLSVGDAFYVYCSSGTKGVAGRVKFESTNKKVLTVTSGGQVKAVGTGSASIKAVMKISDKRTTTLTASFNITVS